MTTRQSFSAYWSDALGLAIRESSTDNYTMSLVGNDAKAVKDAVNQGIDSHLEACFVPDRGDSYQMSGFRMNCSVSPESLPVLVRRLMESDNEDAQSLASGICETLNIELV